MEFAAQIRITKHRNVNVIDVVGEKKKGGIYCSANVVILI